MHKLVKHTQKKHVKLVDKGPFKRIWITHYLQHIDFDVLVIILLTDIVNEKLVLFYIKLENKLKLHAPLSFFNLFSFKGKSEEGPPLPLS